MRKKKPRKARSGGAAEGTYRSRRTRSCREAAADVRAAARPCQQTWWALLVGGAAAFCGESSGRLSGAGSASAERGRRRACGGRYRHEVNQRSGHERAGVGDRGRTGGAAGQRPRSTRSTNTRKNCRVKAKVRPGRATPKPPHTAFQPLAAAWPASTPLRDCEGAAPSLELGIRARQLGRLQRALGGLGRRRAAHGRLPVRRGAGAAATRPNHRPPTAASPANPARSSPRRRHRSRGCAERRGTHHAPPQLHPGRRESTPPRHHRPLTSQPPRRTAPRSPAASTPAPPRRTAYSAAPCRRPSSAPTSR